MSIRSKPYTKQGRKNFDKIFGNKKVKPKVLVCREDQVEIARKIIESNNDT